MRGQPRSFAISVMTAGMFPPTLSPAIAARLGSTRHATDIDALAVRLAESPTEGPVIVETGGVRKLRVGMQGRGRRGGARVIYYYRNVKGRVYLLFAYANNEADDLSDDGKSQMASLVEEINREL